MTNHFANQVVTNPNVNATNHDVLIEFDSEVDVEWVVHRLLRIEWCMEVQCDLECLPCSDEELLKQF